jgi:hypothetical protein
MASAFQRRRDDARADPFGEDQNVTRPRTGVGFHARRMNRAGDRVAELDFIVCDAVSAQDGAPRLMHLLGAALEDRPQVVEIALGRVGQDGERRNRLAAHGVHVAQRIGCGDGAEGLGVVNDRRKEVDRLHQGELRRQLVHAGIVGSVKPDQNILVGPTGHGGQYLVQNLWTELGRSTRGFHVRRKLLQ